MEIDEICELVAADLKFIIDCITFDCVEEQKFIGFAH